ncbi:phosphatase PAP2 family protein [Ancylobacter sonchi]|uniref:phosphatase PAP2 family protein n=1 Tax=Ancylobacter sonchi TaxID=1937790 RepID=UPI001BD6DC1B|nr:phosphatase PAP2 family protein [Ancylobacter sonchi]MBS7536605.1 phosphatase PAP2 family protein [Ancylobacter sonchi]
MRFKVFCAENRVIACLLATLLLSSAFILFPGIDLAISRQFYVPGIGFPLAHSGLLQDVRMAGSNIPVTVAVVVFAALVLKLLHPLRPCLLPPRFALYFASLYLLGPVLLVNGVLKTFWGRPRPVKVEEFGGSVPFLDAWSLGESFTHRSFASGEAATIACLLPLALFVPRPWRWRVAAMLGVVVALVSLNRVAFGGHFLSDITVAIALVLTIAVALRQIFYVSHAELFADARLDTELTRLGLAAQSKTRRDLDAAAALMRNGLARLAGPFRRVATQRLAAQRLTVSASILPAE